MPSLKLKDSLWVRKPIRDDDEAGKGLDLKAVQRKTVL